MDPICFCRVERVCATNSKSKKAQVAFYLSMILFGVVSGLSGVQILQDFGMSIPDVFIKIFKCISLPIIALSIIVTISSYSAKDSGTYIWKKTLSYTISTTLIAAAVSCFLYILISPDNVMVHLDTTLKAGVLDPQQNNYFKHLTTLIPSSIFSPFLEHQVMGVLLIGIVIGLAIRHIPDQNPRQSVTDFFIGVHGIFITITRWVVAAIPIGLYGFITATIVQLREGANIKGIGKYLIVIILANLVQGFVILPLWLRWHKIAPFVMMRQMMPALAVAFFSKSSAGTLPITIETAERQLKISPKISRFVLPLCTTINMNGCAAFIFVTVIYLMQNHGISITFDTMLVWVFVSSIAAIGNAGVPMGCFFLSASLLASMDVPITLLGLILPFYSIIDMVETSLNVWSDTCVTRVVQEKVTIQKQAII